MITNPPERLAGAYPAIRIVMLKVRQNLQFYHILAQL